MVKVHEFATSQEAWEGLNEYFFNCEEDILKNGGRYGSQLVAYNTFINIRKAWVDPNFDFGNMFGYRMQKWTGLINNYVNLNFLDILKSQILAKEETKYPQYNISMQFDNSHGHGKNCLLSLTFSRRLDMDIPVATFNLRSSEITKRLLLDLLLVQRIAEYIYGEEKHIMINLFCGNIYQNAEAFTMYDQHRKLKKIRTKESATSPWANRVMEILEKFKTVHPDEIKYKVFKRAVNQLQNVHGDKPMKTKDLPLIKKDIEYPEDCITVSQRRKYKREFNKKKK